jgi:hypothetical protein
MILLLIGFALLPQQFENSRVPDDMPASLPDRWKVGLAPLAIVFVLSSFLHNIAASLIAGAIALAILGWNPDPPHKVELRSAHITQITPGDVS